MALLVQRYGSTGSILLLIAVAIGAGSTWFKVQSTRAAGVRPFYLERGFYDRGGSGALSMSGRETLGRRSDGTTALVEEDNLK